MLLKLDAIGVHDDFFDLGGDSIRSIQMRAQAQKAGYDFSVQQIFEHQTIAELALEAMRIDGPATQSLKVGAFDLITPDDRARIPADIEDAYPLSLLQRGMLFHSELNQQLAIYHDIIGFHLRGPLDRTALETAIDRLVTRHPVLRTSFELEQFFADVVEVLVPGVAAVGVAVGAGGDVGREADRDPGRARRSGGTPPRKPGSRALSRRAESMPYFVRNADGDELHGRELRQVGVHGQLAVGLLARRLVAPHDFVAHRRHRGLALRHVPALRRPEPSGEPPARVR